MADIKELEDKMKAVMAQAKECVDMSLELAKEDQEAKNTTYRHWENFLTHFFQYIKHKEKETGVAVMKGIPLTKLIKFL